MNPVDEIQTDAPFAPLGAWLLALRTAAGQRQRDTAKAAGCSDLTWRLTEAGTRAPGTDELARVLDFLGATPEQRVEVARITKILHVDAAGEDAHDA